MLRAIVGACTSVMTAVERKYFLIFFIVRNAYFTHFSQNFRKISHFTGLHKTPKKPTYFTKNFTGETGDLLLATKEYLIHLENMVVIKIEFIKTQGSGNCIVCI